MSILNFTTDDLNQINSRAIQRLRSQDNRAGIKGAENADAPIFKPAAAIGTILRYDVGGEGIVEVRDDALAQHGSGEITSPSSTASNFIKRRMRQIFKLAKGK